MQKKHSLLTVIILGILLLIILLVFIGLFIKGLADCREYAQVYKDPVYVEAIVTKHTKHEDSEGDISYQSYVSYTVDGRTYKNVSYESESLKSKLTPVSTQITLAVNPNDHGVLMEKLANGSLMVLICGIILIIALTAALQTLRKRKVSRQLSVRADRQIVTRDLCRFIMARFFRVLWLFITIFLLYLTFRFPMLYGKSCLIAAAVTGTFWLICMYTTIRDFHRVKNGEFEIHWDVLVSKEEKEDSDSDPVYILHYGSANRRWKQIVDSSAYHKARVGQVSLQAVYMSGNIKPVLYYDSDGNAVQ